ncbi:MAG TPA: EF-hand domain-containing protein [Novosphingobium sp.]|nr:EF-hand domain-containing protein [Novosphingobium sp.]
MALAVALAGAGVAHAQMGGMGGMGGGGMGGMGGGGGGMGGGPPSGGGDEAPADKGPPKPHVMKPIPQKKFDEAVTQMFAAADTNHDGLITLAEFQAQVEARRDAIIRARFQKIDLNHDGQISQEEFISWQLSLGSMASADTGGRANVEVVAEEIGPKLGNSEQDMALAMAIEPINPVMLVKANTNYDAGVSLAELLAYEDARFAKADTDRDGYLTMEEIRAMMPARGPGGRGPGGRGPGGMMPPPGDR